MTKLVNSTYWLLIIIVVYIDLFKSRTERNDRYYVNQLSGIPETSCVATIRDTMVDTTKVDQLSMCAPFTSGWVTTAGVLSVTRITLTSIRSVHTWFTRLGLTSFRCFVCTGWRACPPPATGARSQSLGGAETCDLKPRRSQSRHAARFANT